MGKRMEEDGKPWAREMTREKETRYISKRCAIYRSYRPLNPLADENLCIVFEIDEDEIVHI